jgi:hypothetical protein
MPKNITKYNLITSYLYTASLLVINFFQLGHIFVSFPPPPPKAPVVLGA